MATYKVPQDVEADDKLLGPFSFRQFIYLMICLGCIMLMVGLFQIFPLLAIIPIPVIIFFGALALPLKKDQPMETYLAALISFYFKPNKRFWVPGQRESTIIITNPKKVEPSRTRNITEEEAGHRLSFLADIVDTEGYAIKSANNSMRDEFYSEAYNTTDMFDSANATTLRNLITEEQQQRHAAAVNQMRVAIANSEYNQDNRPSVSNLNQKVIQPRSDFDQSSSSIYNTNSVNFSGSMANIDNSSAIVQPIYPTQPTAPVNNQMRELANNPDFSIATIEQQANRISQEQQSNNSNTSN